MEELTKEEKVVLEYLLDRAFYRIDEEDDWGSPEIVEKIVWGKYDNSANALARFVEDLRRKLGMDEKSLWNDLVKELEET